MFCATKDIASCEFTTKKKFAWIDPKTDKPIMIDITSGDEDGINGHINHKALAKLAEAGKAKITIGASDARLPGKQSGGGKDESQPRWEIKNPAIKGL